MECPNCNGKGEVYTSEPCGNCNGSGKIKAIDDYGKEVELGCYQCDGTGKDKDTCNLCGGVGTV